MNPNIGLEESDRKAVSDKLAALLANEYVLSLKTRKAHWNVQGIDFADKHALFEEQYNQLSEIVDDVAERINCFTKCSEAKDLSIFLHNKITSTEN